MPTYQVDKHDGDISQMVALVMSKFHQPLVDAGVLVDVVVALPSDNDGSDIVKLHGRECYATISVVPYKMRVRGLGDATLLVDGPKWNDMPERQRAALIDHELHHLELAMTKGKTVGEIDIPPRVKRDDLERPKLKLRPHDWEIGGFDLIVERHRDHSIEIMQCREMLGGASGPVRQALLPFMADDIAPKESRLQIATDAPGVKKSRPRKAAAAS